MNVSLYKDRGYFYWRIFLLNVFFMDELPTVQTRYDKNKFTFLSSMQIFFYNSAQMHCIVYI